MSVFQPSKGDEAKGPFRRGALAFLLAFRLACCCNALLSKTDAHPNESFSIFHFRCRHRGVYLRMRHFGDRPRRSNRTEHLQDGGS
jgi:hypothetical protein